MSKSQAKADMRQPMGRKNRRKGQKSQSKLCGAWSMGREK